MKAFWWTRALCLSPTSLLFVAAEVCAGLPAPLAKAEVCGLAIVVAVNGVSAAESQQSSSMEARLALMTSRAVSAAA